MRAPRHAAIAVMALTASTYVAAQDIGRFNPDAPGNIYFSDALEVPISPVVAPADALVEVPLPRPRPPLRDIRRRKPSGADLSVPTATWRRSGRHQRHAHPHRAGASECHGGA
jgi:hypothetical protein